ncbi:molybdate ABC transporter substrate-binding protein [Nitrobacter winogradskyi]|uniref:Molybdenum ABC transporter molybdate-binding protein n=2 Tax=Nitrobacter winogradskyi TaxID=913 RepID=A0ACC6AEA8_NITWI|nr:molybdate ABC transporter substrate-binding protein [Nitrobacter winogradskyi]MCP1997621.1 molybdenum ABC transporter molybdate-binding protein [Nitrobacter winogradskyi]GEC17106.1 ABC transporter substrate-binding protein [Nitrobacter winogradskyi]
MRTRFIAIACASVFTLVAIGTSRAGAQEQPREQMLPLRVFAAGSTRGVLAAIADDYTKATGQRFELTFGPAGLLLDRIRKEGGADVYVSANMRHPQRLFQEGAGTHPVIFARNRLCVTGRSELGLTQDTLLDKLLAPSIKIGTSTPGADPGGDYAQEFFDRAETVRAGAKERLVKNARQLVGGPTSPKLPAGETAVHYFFSRHEADVFIGYCSSHTKIEIKTEKPSDVVTTRIEVPRPLTMPINYGLTVLVTSENKDRGKAAYRFALYLMSPEAQRRLPEYGFLAGGGP